MEWSKVIYKKISAGVVDLCVAWHISADGLTYFNHFITLTFGCYFFARGDWIGLILGLGVMLINGFLDYLDGDVAKATTGYTQFGVWIDSGFDVIIQNAVMAAIAFGCFTNGLSLIWILLFFIANAANNLVSFNYNQRFGFDSAYGNFVFRDFMDKRPHLFNRIMKNIIDPTSSPIGLMILTCRYWITLGAIFNIMPYCFIILTIISNFKWAIMFYLYGQNLKKADHLYILHALAALDNERKEFYELRKNGG